MRTVAIKNAIGIIFHFYAKKLDFNGIIEFSIDTDIIKEKYLENFAVMDFNICPLIDGSLNPLLVLQSATHDILGVFKNNVNEVGEIDMGYSNDPYCVKIIYKGTIGLSVRWK